MNIIQRYAVGALSITLLAVGISCSATAKAQTICTALDNYVCREENGMAVYAQNAEEANAYVTSINDAAKKYKGIFDKQPGPGAIILVNDGTLSGAIIQQVQDAGATWFLPWQSFKNPDKKGLPATEKASRTSEAAHCKPSSFDDALPHELGHVWFRNQYWPKPKPAATGTSSSTPSKASSQLGSHYGSPGPDWLDEMAAISMETDNMTDCRRLRFIHSLSDPKKYQRIENLPAFFETAHPYASWMKGKIAEMMAQKSKQAGAGGATILKLNVSENDMPGGIEFYLTNRAVLDFFTEQKNPDALASLARHFSANGDIEQWLKQQEGDFPKTIADLQTQWKMHIETLKNKNN
jgi:hypothetical protein